MGRAYETVSCGKNQKCDGEETKNQPKEEKRVISREASLDLTV